MIWFWIVAGIIVLFGFTAFFGAPYVPSHRKYVRLAFTKLYRLKPDDVVVDLGSGDGRVLRVATKHGARAIGYELNPLLVLVSRILGHGDKKQSTILTDMWSRDMPEDTTVVYVFSVSRDARKLVRKLQKHVNMHGSQLWCVVYGPDLNGSKEPVRKLHAHTLYLFEPEALQ